MANLLKINHIWHLWVKVSFENRPYRPTKLVMG